jgi:hypothetical protein
VRVAVLVRLLPQQPAARLEVRDHELGHLVRTVPDELAVPLDEEPGLVDRDEHRQLLAPADLEVLGAAAGRDVDDARALVQHDRGVGHDAMGHLGLRGEVVEAGRIRAADELLAPHAADDLRVCAEDRLAAIPGHHEALTLVLDPDVLGVGLDGRRDVRRERPGRGRPHDERLARGIGEAEAHVERRIDEIAIGIGSCDFML